jgi:hypothetical protein
MTVGPWIGSAIDHCILIEGTIAPIPGRMFDDLAFLPAQLLFEYEPWPKNHDALRLANLDDLDGTGFPLKNL